MAYYSSIVVRSLNRPVVGPRDDESGSGEDSDDTYFPTVHVEARHHVCSEDSTEEAELKRKRGTVDYCYALFDGLPPSSPAAATSYAPVWTTPLSFSCYLNCKRLHRRSVCACADLLFTHSHYYMRNDGRDINLCARVRAWLHTNSTYAELVDLCGGAASAEGKHDKGESDDDTEEDTDQGNYYVPDMGYFAPYNKALASRLNPEHEHEEGHDKNIDGESTAETATEMEWTVLKPTQQPQPAAEQAGARDHGKTDPEVYRILTNADADLVKAAVRRYAESLAPEEGEALLRHILGHVQAQSTPRQKIPMGGEEDASDKPHVLPELAKLPLSYGSKVFHAPAQPQQRFVSLSGQGAKSVSATPLARRTKPGGIGLHDSRECPVGDIGRRDKASVVSTTAPVVEKNTKWNETYQDMIAGVHTMPLASVKKLLRLANDFVYTCLTYTKVIVNELNMPNDRKTIKPATDIGGLAGGEKYVIQGILFKFCLDPQVSTKGKGVWLYGGSRPSEEKAAKAASLELQGLSLLSSLFVPGLHIPLMALIDFKGFRVLATSLLPLGPDTICYGSHDAGKTVHASNPEFNKMMDDIGGLLNLKKHTVGKKKVPIVGPGDIEGHKALDGRYYLLDYARLMPSQAPIPSEDGKWDGRGVFYQMLRPEFVRSYTTPLSSDVFTGWSMYDTEREQSEREVIAATEVMINERIPALAAELDTVDTTAFGKIYNLSVKEESDPNKIIRFRNLVNLESRMHCAGINIRHLGRLHQLVRNKEMRYFILCAAVSRTLKHKLRNKMRRTVREKRQGDLASEVSCKRVGARMMNKILGQHPKSNDFWRKSVVKSMRKRFPFILSVEELTDTFDVRNSICLRVVVAFLMTQNILRLTPDASNAIFKDFTTVKLVSNDIDAIWANVKFNPIINILEAEVSRRMSAEEKNVGLGLRLLESARIKLRTAINTVPSCSYSHWSIARVEQEIVKHVEYDSVAERIFESIYKHVRISFELERYNGPLITWAEALEMHAERMEKANETARAAELRALAAKKRALVLDVPNHSCVNDDTFCL